MDSIKTLLKFIISPIITILDFFKGIYRHLSNENSDEAKETNHQLQSMKENIILNVLWDAVKAFSKSIMIAFSSVLYSLVHFIVERIKQLGRSIISYFSLGRSTTSSTDQGANTNPPEPTNNQTPGWFSKIKNVFASIGTFFYNVVQNVMKSLYGYFFPQRLQVDPNQPQSSSARLGRDMGGVGNGQVSCDDLDSAMRKDANMGAEQDHTCHVNINPSRPSPKL